MNICLKEKDMCVHLTGKQDVLNCTAYQLYNIGRFLSGGIILGSPPQSYQSAGPVSFLIFCTINIFLLASLVAGRKPQGTAGAD
jgi:hypothetical protein